MYGQEQDQIKTKWDQDYGTVVSRWGVYLWSWAWFISTDVFGAELVLQTQFPVFPQVLEKKKVGRLYWGCALYMHEHWLFFFLFNSCTSLNIPTCRAEELTNAPETSSSSELTRHASVKSTSHKTCMQISGNASRDRNESEHTLPSSH